MHTTHMVPKVSWCWKSNRFVPCVYTLLVTLLLLGLRDAHAQNPVVRWTAEPELEIPKGAFPGEYPIVGTMAVGPDGRMYVSLPYRYKVAIFDPSGKLIKAFGGEGEELGQLKTQVMPFSWRADSLVITDLGLKQLTFWDADGRHLMNQKFSNLTSPDGCYKPGTVRAILTDGNGIVAPGTQIPCSRQGSSRESDLAGGSNRARTRHVGLAGSETRFVARGPTDTHTVPCNRASTSERRFVVDHCPRR